MSPEIDALVAAMGRPPRHPDQVAGLNEADCELVRIGDQVLAATVDSVADEIAWGLYRDPYTMGWVAATAALSDLAAVGARPIGLLFAASWARGLDTEARARAFAGFGDAAKDAGTYLLGGDEGRARDTLLTGVGLGLCDTPLTRVGVRPGDRIVLTGPTGLGAALSLRFIRGEPDDAFPEAGYRPRARVAEGRALVGLAHAAMDTSDGVITTLQTLGALNGVGFALEWRGEGIDPVAAAFCAARGLPAILLWLAEHADFQLVAAIPPEAWEEARRRVPSLVPLGVAVEGETTLGLPDGRRVPLDLDALRDRSFRLRDDPGRLYVESVAWARGLP